MSKNWHISACVVIVAVLFSACSHPSDSTLEQNFLRHEDDFEKLIRMSDHDSEVVRIAPDFTWLDSNFAWPRPESELGFTHERWDEYRAVFRKLGIKEGISRIRRDDPEVTVFLFVSAFGLVTGGSTKGYAYCAGVPPDCLSDSLDRDHSASDRFKPIYKKLKGNWYLFYEWD